jgi:hypothetical protein
MGVPVALSATLEELQANSPFVPPDFKPRGPGAPRPKPPAAKKLEFSGFIELDGKYSFSFYDMAKKTSFWVEMGDARAAVKVVDFNPSTMEVTIESEAGSEVLGLRKPAQPSGPSRAPAGNRPPSPSPNPNPNPNRRIPPPPPMNDDEALKILEKLLLGTFDDLNDIGPRDDNIMS